MTRVAVALMFVAWVHAGLPSAVGAQASEARLAAIDGSVQIGDLEGPEDRIFGLIQDGVVGPSYVFIADSRLQQIRRYALSGELQHKTGRSGRGPGEFYVLTSLAPLSQQRLAVLDEGNRRITIFTADLAIDSEITLPTLFSDICGMGDRLFLQGYHEGATIHEVSTRSRGILRSFGAPPEPVDAPATLAAMAMRNRSQAALICDPTRDQVIEVHRSTRQVRALRTDGSVRWEVDLPGFREVSLQMTARGTLAMVPDPKTDTEHHLAAAAFFDADHLLVQHAVLSRTAPEIDSGELDAWLVNLTTGRVRQIASTWPRLLDRAHGISLYGSNLPFPQVHMVADALKGALW